MTEPGDCWILFVDQYDDLAGDVWAINTDYYGPGRYSGTYDVDGDVRPLIVLRRGLDDLVRFELIDELEIRQPPDGTPRHANAKLLDDSWAATTIEIEVYDAFGNEGMWNGIAGYRGWAKKRPGAFEDGEDVRQKYDVVWMERPAQKIRFTSTEYMGASSGGQMAATVDWFDHQGKDPGSSVTIHDPAGLFPDAFSGAAGIAYYNNRQKRYEAVECHRVVDRATATLTGNTCPGDTINISGFTGYSCGEFIGAPPTTPTTASGSIAGLSGDTVYLRRISNALPNPEWQVIRVTKHAIEFMTDWQAVDADRKIQGKFKTGYVESCESADPEWEDLYTGGECSSP
jgi:hypothetical protein